MLRTVIKLNGNMRHDPFRFNKRIRTFRNFMGFSPSQLLNTKLTTNSPVLPENIPYAFMGIVILPL